MPSRLVVHFISVTYHRIVTPVVMLSSNKSKPIRSKLRIASSRELQMNSNLFTSIPTHFGDTRVSRARPQDRRNEFSPVEYKLRYINNLPIDVVVQWRSGLKFVVPSQPSMEESLLIARVEIILHPSVKVDIQRLLSVVDENATSELRAMRESYTLQIQENSYGGATLVLDYPLTLEQLKQYGGTIYYSELDSVISLLPYDEVPPHPYSEEGRRSQTVVGSPIDHANMAFGYAVEIIDNAGKHGDRYLNINQQVYKVTAKRDWTRRDGIYIVTNHTVEGEFGVGGIASHHYPFATAEETLGLYRTYEEALTLGDALAARKLEITNLEHAITLNKVEALRVKQRHDMEMIEKDRQLKEFETDLARKEREMVSLREKNDHEMKLERERLKDFYEFRSYQRKEQTETLKFLPSIIVGIGAIFMAIKTFLPGK